MYQYLYVGAGPATIFSVLHLLKNGCKDSICILEGGKSIKVRPKNEITRGFAGGGLFSDSKLTSALDVGGIIPNLTEKELNLYSDEILKYINSFGDGKLNWGDSTPFNTKDSTLEWNIHKTCHVGTDNGQVIYSKIEDYIQSQPNVDLFTEYEVKDIFKQDNGTFQVIANDKSFEAKNLIIATGQKSTLPNYIREKFNFRTI